MRNIRVLVILLVVNLIIGIQCNTVNASGGETPNEGIVMVEYDLEKGGIQTFNGKDEDGEYEIIIEELKGSERIANGTYKVTKTSTNAWTAGFYVKISSNKFTNAYGAFYEAMKGTISGGGLVKNSSTKVTLSFTHCVEGKTKNRGICAQISGGKLAVNKL